MKKSPLARKTALKAKKGFTVTNHNIDEFIGLAIRRLRQSTKRPATGHRKPQVKRKVTKASKLRRKKGEWSTATADTHFSRYIRERDGKCLRCHTTEGLTCSHYHGRGKSATRFCPINCIALCWKCHQEWEGPKAPYTEYMIQRLGNEGFMALAIKAGTEMKRSDAVAECKTLLT